MKKRNLVSAVLAAAAFVFSCTPEEQVKPPVFELEVPEMTVSSESGEVSVPYVLENADERIELKSVHTAEWIVSVDTDRTGEVVVRYGENEGTEVREAEVDLLYGDIVRTFCLKQLGTEDTEPAAPFAVDIRDVSEVEVVFNVRPADPEMTYALLALPEEMSENYSDEELFQLILEYFSEIAESFGCSLEELLETEVLLSGNVSNARISGLVPDTEYHLLVFGADASGKLTSEIVRESFETLPIEQVSVDFDFEFVDNGTYAPDIKVIPSDNQVRYFSYVVTREEYELNDKPMEDHAQNYVDMLLGLLTGMGGMSLEQALSSILVSGEYTYQHELQAETEYIAYAVAVNELGYVCSEAGTADFTTGTVESSGNEITISLSNINVDRVDYRIETTTDEQYYFTVEESSWKEGMSDEEILEALSKYVYSFELHSGDLEGTYRPLTPGTEHFLYCFGYEGGKPTTDLIKVPFTTLTDPGDPTQFALESAEAETEMTTATVRVKGSPFTVLYYWEICSAAMTEEEALAQINANVDRAVDTDFYAGDRKLYFKMNGSRNTATGEFTSLLPGTEYKVCAVAVDETTGEFATGVLFGDVFQTKERVVSDTEVWLEHDRYFDIDELADAYGGDFEAFKGQNRYYLRVAVQTEGDAVQTYTAAFSNDVSGSSDAELIYSLVDSGQGLTDGTCEFALPYDKDVTLVSVARDGEGNYSVVYRETINYDRAGAADVSEYEPLQSRAGVSRETVGRKSGAAQVAVPAVPAIRTVRSGQADGISLPSLYRQAEQQVARECRETVTGPLVSFRR